LVSLHDWWIYDPVVQTTIVTEWQTHLIKLRVAALSTRAVIQTDE